LRIVAIDPMPSGEGAGETAQAAGGVDGAAAQGDEIARAKAVPQAGAEAARQPLRRTRTGAEATMEAAAAVRHGRLPAAATHTGAGAAARRLQVIASRIAVLEAPAALAGRGVELRSRRCGRTGLPDDSGWAAGCGRGVRADDPIGSRGGSDNGKPAQPLDPFPDSLNQPGREHGHAHGFEARPLVRVGRPGAIKQSVGADRTLHREFMANRQLLHERHAGGGVGHVFLLIDGGAQWAEISQTKIRFMICSHTRFVKMDRSFVVRSFGANAVRLQLHALACNLGNFLRTLATLGRSRNGR
jgi:hypothetical protein